MDDFAARLEHQARQIESKPIHGLREIRKLLILSAATSCIAARSYFETRLSNPELLSLLVSTIRDADGFYSGDARIQAASYLRRFDRALLNAHADELLALYDAEDDEGAGGCLRGLLSCALAVARAPGGKERILTDADPERPDNWLFIEALREYDESA